MIHPNYVIRPKRGDKIVLNNATLGELSKALKQCRVRHNPVLELTVHTRPHQ